MKAEEKALLAMAGLEVVSGSLGDRKVDFILVLEAVEKLHITTEEMKGLRRLTTYFMYREHDGNWLFSQTGWTIGRRLDYYTTTVWPDPAKYMKTYAAEVISDHVHAESLLRLLSTLRTGGPEVEEAVAPEAEGKEATRG